MGSSDGGNGSGSAVGTAVWSLGDLELELVRIRSEARAARLEARAAEIELQARRLRKAGKHAAGTIPVVMAPPAEAPPETTSFDASAGSASTPPPVDHSVGQPPPVAPPLNFDWEQLVSAFSRRPPDSTVSSVPAAIDAPLPSLSPNASETPSPDVTKQPSSPLARSSQQETRRRDAEHPAPKRPAGRRSELSKGPASKGPERPFRAEAAKEAENKKAAQHPKRLESIKGSEPNRGRRSRAGHKDQKQRPVSVKGRGASAKEQRPVSGQEGVADRQRDAVPTAARRAKRRPPGSLARGDFSSPTLPSQGLALDGERGPVAERRRRPAAWVMSTLAHIGVLLLLAALTLRPPPPKDQLSFSATAPRAASEELESMVIEPMESNEPSEQVPVEDAVEIDPLGDLAAASPASVQQPAASAPEAMAFSDSLDVSQMLLESDAQATTEFCGVAGGGNHFCYIVDSSKSMKNGRFDSARAELLRSIDRLKKDQRFYVIFYDVNMDRMCVSDPSEPDAYSVNATLENKRALRQWAMQIGLERGAPPDKALKFAFTLRPDAIFLLSDGEFPERIEDLVAELNHDENLFGEQKTRSILHTIGYHSRDGEQRMRQLAEANGGQYHYVPGPK